MKRAPRPKPKSTVPPKIATARAGPRRASAPRALSPREKPPSALPRRSNVQSRALKGLGPAPSRQVVDAESDALDVLPPERSLLDVVDNLLSQGVYISGDAVLGVADVDLVYLKLSVLLCAVDRLTR